MNTTWTDNIDNILDALFSSVGIYHVMSVAEFDKKYDDARRSSRSRFMDLRYASIVIARHVGITQPVDINWVDEGSLRRTDQDAFTEVPARVRLPPHMDALTHIPIDIDKKYQVTVGYRACAFLAHEYAHVALKLSWCEPIGVCERDREQHTDLAAIVLGLGELMDAGDYGDAHGQMLGYLCNEALRYARARVSSVSRKCDVQKRAYGVAYRRNYALVKQIMADYQLFKTNLQCILQCRPPVRVKPTHGAQFVEMTNCAYQDDLSRALTAKMACLDELAVETVPYQYSSNGKFAPGKAYYKELLALLDGQFASLHETQKMLGLWLKLENKYLVQT